MCPRKFTSSTCAQAPSHLGVIPSLSGQRSCSALFVGGQVREEELPHFWPRPSRNADPRQPCQALVLHRRGWWRIIRRRRCYISSRSRRVRIHSCCRWRKCFYSSSSIGHMCILLSLFLLLFICCWEPEILMLSSLYLSRSHTLFFFVFVKAWPHLKV